MPELMDTEQQRAAARELARQAGLVPAIGRLRELVAFVGAGRVATQAGKLKPADAVAVARRLSTSDKMLGCARSMADLPEVAHVFQWATAAGFLTRRGTRIVAGPCARELEHDPLAAWTRAAIVLLDHGVLDGFRLGWRKTYVERLDADAPFLLAVIREAGGALPLSTIEDRAWPRVAAIYGYDLDDAGEREHVAWLLRAMVAQFTDLGAAARHDDDVVLTELGDVLATAATAAEARDRAGL
ncbi:MAG: hypothetical protein ACLP01_29725 [Solirubrobacteraceae bacterium]